VSGWLAGAASAVEARRFSWVRLLIDVNVFLLLNSCMHSLLLLLAWHSSSACWALCLAPGIGSGHLCKPEGFMAISKGNS
jgi:hypothetical protein